MTHVSRFSGWIGALLALMAAGAALSGCFNPFSPLVSNTNGISQPQPIPNSPLNLLALYAWCWNKRDIDSYREIFTDDYQFRFAQGDSAGNLYRDRALTREEELDIENNIFVRGTATEPPPVSISLTFSSQTVNNDSRRGKNPNWHKEVPAQTLLRIHQPEYEVQGITRFFVVRGDSALLPLELKQRGFGPDPLRWYIEEIDDETVLNGTPARAPAAALPWTSAFRVSDVPPVMLTWGEVRALWDDHGATAARVTGKP